MTDTTTFAAKMQAADQFRASIKAAIADAGKGNPTGAAPLRKMGETLASINDAQMWRASRGGDMVLKPLKVCLAAIAKGDAPPLHNMGQLLDRVRAAQATIIVLNANEKQVVELVWRGSHRLPGEAGTSFLRMNQHFT